MKKHIHPMAAPAPPHLEDEAFYIETSGEMPEVALEEAVFHLGPLDENELNSLRAAAARGYMAIIERDISPGLVGSPSFRGLERALANLHRLRRFLGCQGWGFPAEWRDKLAQGLTGYLSWEKKCLKNGRAYATATGSHARALLAELGLNPLHFKDLSSEMDSLGGPDFIGLRALWRLDRPGAVAKRRRLDGRSLVIEVLGPGEKPLASAALNLELGGEARAELVWSLLGLPEKKPA